MTPACVNSLDINVVQIQILGWIESFKDNYNQSHAASRFFPMSTIFTLRIMLEMVKDVFCPLSDKEFNDHLPIFFVI